MDHFASGTSRTVGGCVVTGPLAAWIAA